MQVLEDHNRQLEAQLQRLRQLLDQVNIFVCLSSVFTFLVTYTGVLLKSGERTDKNG